jgi:hypothetical protein
MWYRFAAYGTIDLQKYIPEKLGEDFDVDAEISNLLTSSLDGKKLDFDLLNENLSKSPLKSLINEFLPSYSIGRKAQINFNTKTILLSVRSPIQQLIQSLKHELRHAVDKGRPFRPDWINRNRIDQASNYFSKFKNKLLDQNGNFVYDIDRMIFEMIFLDMMNTDENFNNLSEEEQIEKVAKDASKIKRKDLLTEIFQSLVSGEKYNNIQDNYYINDPLEYVTHLSDIDNLFSPQALSDFAQKYSIDDEHFIDMMKQVISTLNVNSDFSTLRYISSDGASLIEGILQHSKNPQMIRNVYKILSENLQKYISQYAYSADQFKEAKKDYNAPRTGKKKKRWSVKYKKNINCNSPKGFSQKNYCKRKRRGGKYKTEG